MKLPRKLLFVTCVALASSGVLAGPGGRTTKVEIWLDTEDYTSERSADAIRDLAKLLTEEGVRGHFNVVGYLALTLQRDGRRDVIDALKPHCIGTQTLYHSRHPVIGEYCDIADHWAAYGRCMREEAQCVGMVKAVFGRDFIPFSVLPGPNAPIVAFDVYADLGIPTSVVYDYDDGRRGKHWYCNQLMVQYNADDYGFYLENLLQDDYTAERMLANLDKVADFERIAISMHPHRAVKKQFWDIENFLGGNLTEFGKWAPTEYRDPEVTARFYRRLREVIRGIRADGRFEFDDWEQVLAAVKPRTVIRPADIPAIRRAFEKRLVPLESPASWCIADVFQAAVKFLRGETEHMPGRVHGFLSLPSGVTGNVRVRTADLKEAAKKIDLGGYLPVEYDVGGVKLGPADFLMAALEALETGAEDVTVKPCGSQLGDLEGFAPGLAKYRHRWCIFSKDFKDRYLSDRLRYQFWTFRYE